MSKKRRRTLQSRDTKYGYLFVLPFAVGFALFMVDPLIESLRMSFSSVTISVGQGYKKEWLGFANYLYAFTADAYFNKLLVEEVSRMVVNSMATLVLSFVIAVILNQDFKGRVAARAIFFLPVILSSGVLAGIETRSESYNLMQAVAQQTGAASTVDLSGVLKDLLMTSGMASQVFTVLFDMIDAIYEIIMASGIQIIVFLSGLQTIPRSLYEASSLEGCSAWENFWKITFPMVSPLLLVNTIYTIIDFFNKSDNRLMERINTLMYNQYNFGVSAAMSWIYFVVALAFIGLSALIIRKGVRHYA